LIAGVGKGLISGVGKGLAGGIAVPLCDPDSDY
jgi:hypothetical protein